MTLHLRVPRRVKEAETEGSPRLRARGSWARKGADGRWPRELPVCVSDPGRCCCCLSGRDVKEDLSLKGSLTGSRQAQALPRSQEVDGGWHRGTWGQLEGWAVTASGLGVCFG